MKFYDCFIDFAIDTEYDTYEMSFTSDWRFSEILDFMLDRFSIDQDSIVEIRHTYVKRYKVLNDD